ncbi:hypothetical protein HGA92_04015 [Candidatus Gracilibacteria bacterium]|nr:hypothetical protein [Candidatus Gracilibacteria bacterium]NUJ99264.1 hypothetical protein [Candidatus Gracilibacteria bacterium]
MKKIIQDKEVLKNYAIFYYLKYFPSIKKLEEKLGEKSGGDKNFISQIIESLKSIIDEKTNIENRIKYMLDRHKNLSYIKQNLMQKNFDKALVEEILKRDFLKDGESLLDTEYIRRKIISYKEKGKSKNYIKSKLIEREEDKKEVLTILDEIFSSGEEELIGNEYEKLKGKFDKQKIVEKLLRKGFLYEDVKKIVGK